MECIVVKEASAERVAIFAGNILLVFGKNGKKTVLISKSNPEKRISDPRHCHVSKSIFAECIKRASAIMADYQKRNEANKKQLNLPISS